MIEITTANEAHLALPIVRPQNPGDVFHVPQRGAVTPGRASFHLDIHMADDDAIVVNQDANCSESPAISWRAVSSTETLARGRCHQGR